MLVFLLFIAAPLVSSEPWKPITYAECMSEDKSSVAKSMCFSEAMYQNTTAEQAATIGRTPEEHAEYCFKKLPISFVQQMTYKERRMAKEEWFTTKFDRRLSNINEALAYLRERTPTVYTTWMRFKNYLVVKMNEFDFGNEATNFVNGIESALLEIVVMISKASKKEEIDKIIEGEFGKIVSNFWQLSTSARKDLEHFLCFGTFVRLSENGGATLLILHIQLNLEQTLPSVEDIIVKEEGDKIGRTDHKDYCLTRAPQHSFANEEKRRKASNELSHVLPRFNTTDMVMTYIREQMPNTYSIYKSFKNEVRYRAIIINSQWKDDGLKEYSTSFLNSMERIVLETLVSLSQGDWKMTDEDLNQFKTKQLIVAFRKVKSYYDSRSESEKNYLERMFCLRTIFRVFRERGWFKQWSGVEEAINAIEASS